MSYAAGKFFNEILTERALQEAKWGEQNHPDADPVILDRLDRNDHWADPLNVELRLADEYSIPHARAAKFTCQQKAAHGQVTWFDILLEEVAEVLEAIVTRNPETIREELVDVAAVCEVWAEALQRRTAAKGEATT